MEKLSLHTALHSSSTQRKLATDIPMASTREIKKLIVEIPLEAHLQIDRMRLDMRRNSIKDLVTEALNDLFKKYSYPPIA